MSEKVLLGNRIKLYPNKTMQRQLDEYFNFSRYLWNISLETWNRMYEEYKSGDRDKTPSRFPLAKELRANVREEWWKNYPSDLIDTTTAKLQEAWSMFFKGYHNKPKFKKAGFSKKSFTFNRKNPSSIRIKNGRLYLPKFKYGIKMTEPLYNRGTPKLCTITQDRDGTYWAGISVEVENDLYEVDSTAPAIGIDPNIGSYNLSLEGKEGVYRFPKKKLEKYYKRVKYYQKSLARKQKGSKTYIKTRTKLNKTWTRIKNIRKNWLHKFTTMLVTKYSLIGIENLHVKGMLKNHRLAASIANSMFYTFKEFLSYKCELYGNDLIIADRFFPSTQICSLCGHRKEGTNKLGLGDRVYKCNSCGESLDRDYNAACNLELYAVRYRAGWAQ